MSNEELQREELVERGQERKALKVIFTILGIVLVGGMGVVAAICMFA